MRLCFKSAHHAHAHRYRHVGGNKHVVFHRPNPIGTLCHVEPVVRVEEFASNLSLFDNNQMQTRVSVRKLLSRGCRSQFRNKYNMLPTGAATSACSAEFPPEFRLSEDSSPPVCSAVVGDVVLRVAKQCRKKHPLMFWIIPSISLFPSRENDQQRD